MSDNNSISIERVFEDSISCSQSQGAFIHDQELSDIFTVDMFAHRN